MLQKEKNKELEAKARDMERKWNQEKALREVAETRVRALKKKLKAMESQYADADMIKEDDSVATHQTSGVHSRANSLDNAIVGLDVGGSQNANMSLTNAEVTKPRAPPILHDSYGVLDTIDGSLNPVNLVRTASFVRPSADGSPPRESATRKATSQQSPMATSSQSFKETAGTPGISKDNFLPMNDAPKTTIQGDPLVQHSQPLSGPVSANMGPPPRHKSRHDISASVSSFILPIAVEFDSGRAQEQHSEPVSAESINSVEDGYRDFPYGVGSQLSEESSSDLMSFSIAPQRSTSADSSTTTSLFPIIRQQQVSMPYQDNPLPSSDPVFVESQQNVLPNLNLQVPLEPHPPNLFAEEEGAGLTDPFDDLIQQWRPSDGRQ